MLNARVTTESGGGAARGGAPEGTGAAMVSPSDESPVASEVGGGELAALRARAASLESELAPVESGAAHRQKAATRRRKRESQVFVEGRQGFRSDMTADRKKKSDAVAELEAVLRHRSDGSTAKRDELAIALVARIPVLQTQIQPKDARELELRLRDVVSVGVRERRCVEQHSKILQQPRPLSPQR